jgi:hypothetical protein
VHPLTVSFYSYLSYLAALNLNYDQKKLLKVHQQKIKEISSKKPQPILSYEVQKIFPLITRNKKTMQKIKENSILAQNKRIEKRLVEIKTKYFSISNLPNISKIKS